ncbi:VOC family protein [Nostocoides sp. F2B08]|uniref:VOC family protein n=1 Tax=Nostocoides sp. F2B08 TaxID=2653936 RepID=UPI001262AD37|nr:VOC family protein [Tetrasphaera sp. F2B08]KAB7745113.1 VOC family protein [Tetrasphaera sp. F2B08]
MITAIHTLVYSDDPTATRAFFKDVLQWPFVSEGDRGDAGTGTGTGGQDPADWLIFRTGPSELGVHPTVWQVDGTDHRSATHHAIAVMCDDLDATIAELSDRGASFAGDATEMGFGRGATLHVPGADDMLLYQPHHATAFDLGGDAPPTTLEDDRPQRQ